MASLKRKLHRGVERVCYNQATASSTRVLPSPLCAGDCHRVDQGPDRGHGDSCALDMIHAPAIFYGRAKHSSKDEGGPSLQQSRKLKRLDTVASCCGRSALRHPGFAATVALVGFTYGPHIMVSSRSSHSGGTQRRLVSKKAPLGGLPYVLPQPRLQKSARGALTDSPPNFK